MDRSAPRLWWLFAGLLVLSFQSALLMTISQQPLPSMETTTLSEGMLPRQDAVDSSVGHLVAHNNTVLQRQNASFFRALPCLRTWMKTSLRLALWHPFHACGDGWAYKHIFKSGGTTMQLQCNTTTLGVDRPTPFLRAFFAQRQFFTFVRDPVDHFLSGAAECAARKQLRVPVRPTNASLWQYLSNSRRHGCFQHSIPQIEFLLYDKQYNETMFLDQIQFVGDISVMKLFFLSQGLPWDDARVERRHYGHQPTSSIKAGDENRPRTRQHFNFTDMSSKNGFVGLRAKLSNETLYKICDYVKIDYCFFDYTPPIVCQDLVQSFCHGTCHAS